MAHLQDRPRRKPYSHEPDDRFKMYYCLCGEYSLILEQDLSSFPQRTTDSAFIINNLRTIYRWNAKQSDEVLLKRSGGLERQQRYCCPRCELCVGYKAVGDSQVGDYTYILPTALTSEQGVVPETFKRDLADS